MRRIRALLALCACAPATLAQFQSSSTTSSASASGNLVTTIGNRSKIDGGPGIGAYPNISRDATADDGVGTNAFRGTGSFTLTFDPSQIFADADASANISGTEEIVSGEAAGEAQFDVVFTIAAPTQWRIDSGSLFVLGNGSGSVSLKRGSTQIFSYTSVIANASGLLQPGQYTLSGRVQANSNWNSGGGTSSANLSFQFALTEPVETCPGDFNGDSAVDDADFSIFAVAYNILDCSDSTMASGCPADLNSDGFVDDADFSRFVVAYNDFTCPTFFR